MIPCFRKMSKHAVRRLQIAKTENKQFHHVSRLTTQPQKASTALKCPLASD